MSSTDPLGSALNPIVNPKNFTWAVPTANAVAVDGTTPAFDAKSEVTGYLIGVRDTKAGTAPGTYAIQAAVSDPAATSDPLTALQAVFQDGIYAAAIQTVGPQNSVWSSEVFFQVAHPIPVPLPPSGFTAS